MNICNAFSNTKQFNLKTYLRQSFIFLAILGLASCATQKPTGPIIGLVGGADENTRQVGQNILKKNGNAADAMAAMLFASSVAYPSRSGLGGGAVCQILDSEGSVKTLSFLPTQIEDTKVGVPALAKGAFMLQSNFGAMRWSDVVLPAAVLASNGIVISDEFEQDVLNAKRLPKKWIGIQKKDLFKQPELADTLRKIAASGSGVLYSGDIASSLVRQSDPLSSDVLRSYRVALVDSIDVVSPYGRTFFANPVAISNDAYVIWKNLTEQDEKKQSEAQYTIKSLKEQSAKKTDAQYAGLGLFAADDKGLAVSCTVTMGGLFGNGELTKQGFFLSDGIQKDKIKYSFVNLMHTNPDVTDVQWTSSTMYDYALPDALEASFKILSAEEMTKRSFDGYKRAKKDVASVSVGCQKGYPNQPQLCVVRDNADFVYGPLPTP